MGHRLADEPNFRRSSRRDGLGKKSRLLPASSMQQGPLPWLAPTPDDLPDGRY
jgi:hypothetical protein